MSALGQKRTFTDRRPMSALPPLADMLKNRSEINAADFQKSLRRSGFLTMLPL
jgi:hypothetical protein